VTYHRVNLKTRVGLDPERMQGMYDIHVHTVFPPVFVLSNSENSNFDLIRDTYLKTRVGLDPERSKVCMTYMYIRSSRPFSVKFGKFQF